MPDKTAQRLLEIIQALSAAQAGQLLEYAEFLHMRYGQAPDITDPLELPRPTEESVVRAIKRLRVTYPMLDPATLLGEASELMSQHVVRGRDRVEVIDELEVLFRSHYEQLIKRIE